jgi:hypothetical protein
MSPQSSLLLNDSMWVSQVNFKPKKRVVTYTACVASSPLSDDNGVSAAAMQSGDY